MKKCTGVLYDEPARCCVSWYSYCHGPVPATGKTIAADYVYAMEFDGDKISRMTKIWNDGHSMKELGWA